MKPPAPVTSTVRPVQSMEGEYGTMRLALVVALAFAARHSADAAGRGCPSRPVPRRGADRRPPCAARLRRRPPRVRWARTRATGSPSRFEPVPAHPARAARGCVAHPRSDPHPREESHAPHPGRPRAVAALVARRPASAHKAIPNFLTRVDAITPRGHHRRRPQPRRPPRAAQPSGEDVVIEGYDDEPYARIDADGTVAVNTQLARLLPQRGPLRRREVPDGVDGRPARRAGRCSTRRGRFEWHDHRMHWMAQGAPPQVEDRDARTKVFEWTCR